MNQKSTSNKFKWYAPFDGNGSHFYTFADGTSVRIGGARSIIDEFIRKGVAHSLDGLTANVVREYCKAQDVDYTEEVSEIGTSGYQCTTITRIY